ncbi:MAG TPA: hypothetical protein PK045_02945 [Candidatus Woesebacteria bacterium]|nr:hypothetical protein [Candidatus Woesebacteria bacterium]
MTQSDLLKDIRKYFWDQNFIEIEVPYLNSSLPLEANIYAFKTIWTHHHQNYYLPPSPEFALKKFLANNHQNCFSISHCFRDLEDEGPDHTPEFLMLEWYEVGKNYQDLMLSTKKFISQFLKIEFTNFVLPQNLPNNEPDFNQYFLNKIEPKLPRHGGVFITGYPAFLSPLSSKLGEENNFTERSERAGEAKPEGSEHRKNSFSNQIIAKRFELYINGLEIANGCTENTNSKSILKSFNNEKEFRLKNKLPTHPIDTNFAKISSKLGLVSGIGLGIDRFLKLL